MGMKQVHTFRECRWAGLQNERRGNFEDAVVLDGSDLIGRRP
jgi:hypothetical protein